MTGEHGIAFGQFELRPAQRLLLSDGAPVRLGSRALDILIALISRPGEVISKEELVATVWPNTFVEDNNLRVHLTALRKALGDDHARSLFISNIPGRGYSFVGSVSFQQPLQAALLSKVQKSNLPTLLGKMVGRDETVKALTEQAFAHRLLTIVGPGGIGKSTVAVEVATQLSSSYPDGTAYLDLAFAADPKFIPSLLASALGCPTLSENVLAELIGFLSDRRVLIVLDGCEHLIDATAAFAEALLRGAPGLKILATSREPLRAQGEWVHRLSALQIPPLKGEETAEDIRQFSAVQLFVQEANAALGGYSLTDEAAPFVAEICCRLDGIPLAIELAAARVATIGIEGLAASLHDAFLVLTRGRRTALPRHQTLRATMDWSYTLLSTREQQLLRSLSLIAGAFGMNLARALGDTDELEKFEFEDDLASLVAKSLVAADGFADMRYRLLDTTRAYAREKLRDASEEEAASRRHAEYFHMIFERAEAEWDVRPTSDWVADYRRHLGNLRDALAWCFTSVGDKSIGVALTAAAVPLWFQLSLIDECIDHVCRALNVSVQAAPEDKRRRMQLQAVLGWPQMRAISGFSSGADAWSATLVLAEELGDVDYQLRALWALWVDRTNHAQPRAALALAERFATIASGAPEAAEIPLSDRMRARSLHFLGDQEGALINIRRMLDRYAPPAKRSHMARFQYDQKITARITLARALWVTGHIDQALRETEENIEEALALNHVFTLTHALSDGACPIAIHSGELELADRYTLLLHKYTRDHALDVWRTYADGFRGQILIRTGAISQGLPMLKGAIETLSDSGFVLYRTSFIAALAEGLSLAGRHHEAREASTQALAYCEASGEGWALPELLRVGAEALLAELGADAYGAVENELQKALVIAHEQKALSWELKVAMSLARLHAIRGTPIDAAKVLEPVCARFSEGHARADLRAASALLRSLRPS